MIGAMFDLERERKALAKADLDGIIKSTGR
jgi:hypothetical protein